MHVLGAQTVRRSRGVGAIGRGHAGRGLLPCIPGVGAVLQLRRLALGLREQLRYVARVGDLGGTRSNAYSKAVLLVYGIALPFEHYLQSAA